MKHKTSTRDLNAKPSFMEIYKNALIKKFNVPIYKKPKTRTYQMLENMIETQKVYDEAFTSKRKSRYLSNKKYIIN